MNLVLKCDERPIRGKYFLKRLRDEGKIAAVIYGKAKETLHISVDKRALQSLIMKLKSSNTRAVQLLLDEDETIDAEFKKVALHPVSGEIEHVELYRK
jgi:large subunit ribosomal protein L25